MASSRFPGKPLAQLGNSTLLGNVVKDFVRLPQDYSCFIAGCDEEILNEAERLGLHYRTTPPDATSPAVRVAWALKDSGLNPGDIVVVVQGDEPMVKAEHVKTLVESLLDDDHTDCVNLISPCSPSEMASANVVKVVTGNRNDVLYMSRAAIPCTLHPLSKPATGWKQTGIFGFRWSALNQMAFDMSQGPLELVESIELLRLLEHGRHIRVIRTKDNLIAVDTPEDLLEVKGHWGLQ